MTMESLPDHATKVSRFVIEAGDLTRVRHMLLDAIKAVSELRLVHNNIIQAAGMNLPASTLVDGRLLPRPVDLDIAEAAEMVQVLELLSIGKEV